MKHMKHDFSADSLFLVCEDRAVAKRKLEGSVGVRDHEGDLDSLEPGAFTIAELRDHLLEAILRAVRLSIDVFAADPILNLGVLDLPGVRARDDEHAIVGHEQINRLFDKGLRVVKPVDQVAGEDQVVVLLLGDLLKLVCVTLIANYAIGNLLR